MNVKKLIYFISVVDNLSFTKAAQQYYIAQTAISRYISSLEEEVGVILLERNNRHVLLTDAGKIFYEHAKKLLIQYDEMLTKTRESVNGKINTLKIGFGQYEHSFVSKMIFSFREGFPNINISVAQYHYSTLLNNLKNGTLDIVFALPSSVECVLPEETSIFNICPSTMYLIVNKQNSLAKYNNMPLKYAKGQTFVTLSEDSGPCSIDRLKRIALESDLAIEKIIIANTLESQVMMVESGLGVAFLPSICKKHLNENIQAIKLESFERGHFVAMHQFSNTNPCINVFLNQILTDLKK